MGETGGEVGCYRGGLGANNKNRGARVDGFGNNCTTFSTALKFVCNFLM